MAHAQPQVNYSAQPSLANPADGYATPDAQRQAFLLDALRRSLPLPNPVVNPALGQTYNHPMTASGIARGVWLDVTAVVTVALNGGTAAISSRGPENFFSSVRAFDPATNERVRAPGHWLKRLDIVKHPWPFDPSATLISYDYSPGVYTSPVVNGANQWHFGVWIPFEVAPYDTRGVMNLESATSRAYIEYDTTNSLYGATNESVVVVTGGATATLTSMTVAPQYEFYAPVQEGGQVVIPEEDMTVIHEVIYTRNQNNLSAGGDLQYTLVSGRSYIRMMSALMSNGSEVFGTVPVGGHGASGATQFAYQYDAENRVRRESVSEYAGRIRRVFGRDFGWFLWDWVEKPWDSSEYGEIDLLLSLDNNISTTSPFYQDVLRECLYTAGSAAA